MTALSPAPFPSASLNRTIIAFALLFLLSIPLFAANFQRDRDPNGSPFGGDFAHEYLGGYLILHGDYQRFYDRDYTFALQHDPSVMGMTFRADRYLAIVYPPFYYLLIAPISCLPFHAAAVTWLVLMASCLGLTVWLLARAYPEHPTLIAWALAGALFFPPLLEDLSSGQKATIALLILTSTFLLLDRGRPFLAGLVFGLLAFKPQLTLVIALAMLCKRQGRFVLGGTITGAALVGLSLLVSVDVCGQYLHMSRHMAEYINVAGFPQEKMHCWYGFWRLLLPDQEMSVVQSATLMCGAVTVALLACLLRGRLAFGAPVFSLQFAGCVVATVLLSPHLLTYDLTLLLLPFFLLTRVLIANEPGLGSWRRYLGWIVALLYGIAGISAGLAEQTHVQLSVPLLFVFLAMMAVSAGRLSISPAKRDVAHASADAVCHQPV